MADDFVGFLRNLVKVFPSVGRRPVYLTGEILPLLIVQSISTADLFVLCRGELCRHLYRKRSSFGL